MQQETEKFCSVNLVQWRMSLVKLIQEMRKQKNWGSLQKHYCTPSVLYLCSLWLLFLEVITNKCCIGISVSFNQIPLSVYFFSDENTWHFLVTSLHYCYDSMYFKLTGGSYPLPTMSPPVELFCTISQTNDLSDGSLKEQIENVNILICECITRFEVINIVWNTLLRTCQFQTNEIRLWGIVLDVNLLDIKNISPKKNIFSMFILVHSSCEFLELSKTPAFIQNSAGLLSLKSSQVSLWSFRWASEIMESSWLACALGTPRQHVMKLSASLCNFLPCNILSNIFLHNLWIGANGFFRFWYS